MNAMRPLVLAFNAVLLAGFANIAMRYRHDVYTKIVLRVEYEGWASKRMVRVAIGKTTAYFPGADSTLPALTCTNVWQSFRLLGSRVNLQGLSRVQLARYMFC